MRRRLQLLTLVCIAALALPATGAGASENASCMGQVVGTLAPELGRELGQITSAEARAGVLVNEVQFLAHPRVSVLGKEPCR